MYVLCVMRRRVHLRSTLNIYDYSTSILQTSELHVILMVGDVATDGSDVSCGMSSVHESFVEQHVLSCMQYYHCN